MLARDKRATTITVIVAKRLEMRLVVDRKEEKAYLFPRYTVARLRAVKLEAYIKLKVDDI